MKGDIKTIKFLYWAFEDMALNISTPINRKE